MIAGAYPLSDAALMRRLVALLLLLSLAACSEQVEQSYPTWAEADRAGAVARGWIPPFIPKSARDIRDTHDLDSNRQTLRFVVPPSDVPAMVAGFTFLATVNKAAVSELSAEHGLTPATQAFRVCERPLNGVLLVDRGNGRAVYTTTVEWADAECARG